MKLGGALKKAIELEEWGFAFYTESAKKTKDREGKSMFEFLAGEETKHAERIQKLIEGDTVDEEIEVWVPEIKEIEATIFKRKVPGGRADEKADSLEALNIGIEAEKNSIELYGKLAEQCDNKKCPKVFHKLVSEEQKHLAILEKEVEFVTETGSFTDFKVITT